MIDSDAVVAEVTQNLIELADPDYKEFHAKLIPNIAPEYILGVRTPQLRKYANTLAKDKNRAEAFKEHLPHTYYDEMNLHGFLIEKNRDFENCIKELDTFLDYVDNWATCDCVNPKVLGRHKQELLPIIDIWIASRETYRIRYGIKLLMTHFLEEDYSIEYMYKVAAVKSEEYYVNMMIAWYFATALAKQYDDAVTILNEGGLDVWTHNKAIQKARESYRIDKDAKEYLKTLKRR